VSGVINLSVDTSEAEAMLRGMGVAVDDLTPAWPQVEKIVMDMERQQFDTEGAYGGEQWEPLNEGYAAYKRRQYGDSRILRATGATFKSLTQRGAPGHYYNAGPAYVEVGTTLPQAGWHQRGHDKPTPLPRRVVIPVPPKEVGEAVADVVLAHMLRLGRKEMEKGRRKR
jgi:hypothetical protein